MFTEGIDRRMMLSCNYDRSSLLFIYRLIETIEKKTNGRTIELIVIVIRYIFILYIRIDFKIFCFIFILFLFQTSDINNNREFANAMIIDELMK